MLFTRFVWEATAYIADIYIWQDNHLSAVLSTFSIIVIHIKSIWGKIMYYPDQLTTKALKYTVVCIAKWIDPLETLLGCKLFLIIYSISQFVYYIITSVVRKPSCFQKTWWGGDSSWYYCFHCSSKKDHCCSSLFVPDTRLDIAKDTLWLWAIQYIRLLPSTARLSFLLNTSVTKHKYASVSNGFCIF